MAHFVSRRGHEVRILDNLSTGRRDNAPASAGLIIGDVAHPVAVQKAMVGTNGVFHLAAIASIERGIGDWVGTHVSNLTGCITVFDAARRVCGGPVPVIYASSATVYGPPRTSNYYLQIFRLLMGFAIDQGLRETNPGANPRMLKTGPGHKPWPDAAIKKFKDSAPRKW